MGLAVETGIPYSVWAAEDDQTILTALSVLEERANAVARGDTGSGERAPGAGGPQYSG